MTSVLCLQAGNCLLEQVHRERTHLDLRKKLFYKHGEINAGFGQEQPYGADSWKTDTFQGSRSGRGTSSLALLAKYQVRNQRRKIEKVHKDPDYQREHLPGLLNLNVDAYQAPRGYEWKKSASEACRPVKWSSSLREGQLEPL